MAAVAEWAAGVLNGDRVGDPGESGAALAGVATIDAGSQRTATRSARIGQRLRHLGNPAPDRELRDVVRRTPVRRPPDARPGTVGSALVTRLLMFERLQQRTSRGTRSRKQRRLGTRVGGFRDEHRVGD